jgi:hypothetical protein
MICTNCHKEFEVLEFAQAGGSDKDCVEVRIQCPFCKTGYYDFTSGVWTKEVCAEDQEPDVQENRPAPAPAPADVGIMLITIVACSKPGEEPYRARAKGLKVTASSTSSLLDAARAVAMKVKSGQRNVEKCDWEKSGVRLENTIARTWVATWRAHP